MGKASQSKKVARAARAAPPPKRSRRRWLWPAGLILLALVGGAVIVESRHESHPAPVQQITSEDTTSTLGVQTSPSSPSTSLNAATATTAAGSTATTVPGTPATPTAGASTTVATSTAP